MRDKVVSNLANSLEKAATELKKEGHTEGLPEATAVATAVEQALQKHFGKCGWYLHCHVYLLDFSTRHSATIVACLVHMLLMRLLPAPAALGI